MSGTPGSGASYNADLDRQDHPQILAGPLSQCRFESIILVAGTNHPAGTVLGKVTASGKYDAYDDGNADGTEVAVGILVDNEDATLADRPARIALKGDFYEDLVIGLDANGKTDLGSKTFVNAQSETILRIP